MNIKKRKAVEYPLMPNQYTGPPMPHGTPSKDKAPMPYWYMGRTKDTPGRANALADVFKNIGQKKVNRQRRPFDRNRGY